MAHVIEITEVTAGQMSAFHKFSRLEIGLDELCDLLQGRFQCGLERGNEWILHRFRLPVHRIFISRKHIHDAIAKFRMGKVGNADLANWASIILMSDIYEFDPLDMDFIGDSLVDIKDGDIPS